MKDASRFLTPTPPRLWIKVTPQRLRPRRLRKTNSSHHNVFGRLEEEFVDLLRQFLGVDRVAPRCGRLPVPRAGSAHGQLRRGHVGGASHVHVVAVRTAALLLALEVHVTAVLPVPVVGRGGGVREGQAAVALRLPATPVVTHAAGVMTSRGRQRRGRGRGRGRAGA